VIAVRPAFDSGKYNPQADMAIHAALASMEYGCLPRTDTVFLGEISILGTAERTRGLLPMLLGAIEHGFTTAVVPQCQVQEARLAEGIQIVGVTGLRQLRDFVQTGRAPMPAKDVERPVITYPTGMWEQIGGQGQAKRALEVAAAGHHHTLMLTGSNTPLPEVMVIGM
jgi:magnesium chelatase family protein